MHRKNVVLGNPRVRELNFRLNLLMLTENLSVLLYLSTIKLTPYYGKV